MGRLKDTVERPSRVRKIVYVVCEGLTEYQYFNYFQDNNRSLGRLIVVKNKTTFDSKQSDRGRLVDIAEGEVNLHKYGKYTPFQYVTSILHEQWDSIIEGIYYNKEDILESLNHIREVMVEKVAEVSLDEDGFVKDYDSADAVIDELFRERSEFKGYSANLMTINPDLRYPVKDTSFDDLDRVFIVFDRDWNPSKPKYHKESEYRAVYQRCSELHYDVLMSTPFFEFWLLLHHPEVPERSYSEMYDLISGKTIKEDLRDLEIEKCVDWKNHKVEDVKSIGKKRFEEFYNDIGFKTALEKSKNLPIDFEQLLKHAGSNVGVKLESLFE